MLSRTADHLFWMSRYTERAENTARMLDVSYQMSLLPQSAAVAQMGWQGLLSISELLPNFNSRYDEVTSANVMRFMVSDENNPSSIISCLRAVRENARAVRGSLTTELWETQNQTWLEAQREIHTHDFLDDPAKLFEWVKFRSHLSRGVTIGTMLKDEARSFMRLGTYFERGDNTARLVDVKYHAIESDFFGEAKDKDQEYDFYHWSAILRSVSAFEIYRKVYRDVIRPDRVAELRYPVRANDIAINLTINFKSTDATQNCAPVIEIIFLIFVFGFAKKITLNRVVFNIYQSCSVVTTLEVSAQTHKATSLVFEHSANSNSTR